jgi:hypothetical protein
MISITMALKQGRRNFLGVDIRSSRRGTGLAKVDIHDQFVPPLSLGHVTHDHATGCTGLSEGCTLQQLLKRHDLFEADPR